MSLLVARVPSQAAYPRLMPSQRVALVPSPSSPLSLWRAPVHASIPRLSASSHSSASFLHIPAQLRPPMPFSLLTLRLCHTRHHLRSRSHTHRIVLPVSPPCSNNTNNRTDNDVSRVVPVIHRAGNRHERRGRDGDEQDPRLICVSALVADAKFCCQRMCLRGYGGATVNLLAMR